jgi:arabinosaccharide transport system substrate-binding protein
MSGRPTPTSAFLPAGAWIIVIGAIVSSVIFLGWPVAKRPGRDFWIFSHQRLGDYESAIRDWNRSHDDPNDKVNVTLLHFYALERRLMAASTADAPVADLVESERNISARVFSGPLEDGGFVDLTERIQREGLLDKMNTPSLSPWMSRGKIFGLPHDVHPCLLGYRADIVEAAGIDVAQIETWDDFRRVLGPLIQDLDGDGRSDRYLLNFWETQRDSLEALMLQAGSHFFDASGHVNVDTALNAHVLATFATWTAGPNRMCVDAPEFTAGGDQMRLDGTVIASILPDWLAGTWKNFIPGLAGKVKVMRLPAWERGGLRTTASGGTCISITTAAKDVEKSWAFAKHLYFSPHVAEELFRSTCTISPVKALWSLPFYHESDAFFSGQKLGELYLKEAPLVPERASSPFNGLVIDRLETVLIELKAYALEHQQFDLPSLEVEAKRLLVEAQADLALRTNRNVLFNPAS